MSLRNLVFVFLIAGCTTVTISQCSAQSDSSRRNSPVSPATSPTGSSQKTNSFEGSASKSDVALSSNSQGSSSKQGSTPKQGESVAWGDSRSIIRQANSNVTPAGSATKPAAGSGSSEKKQPEPAGAFENSRVVAIIGGEPLFVGDMLFEANQIIEKHLPGAPPEVKAKQRKILLKRLVDKYIDQKLLYVDALGNLPEEADLDQFLAHAGSIYDEKVLPGLIESSGVADAVAFDANLRVQGTSLKLERDAWARDQLARSFLSEEITSGLAVTHHEMMEKYTEDREKYARKAKSKWEQVMVRFDRAGSREEARRQIVELGNQLVYGANFEAVAKKSSHGFRADEGGQHDWTGKGALVLKELDKAIFELPLNRLSDVIETRDGFHIIRVKERTTAGFVPFTEAQVEIKSKIRSEKYNKAFKAHLENIRRDILVEHFPLE